LNDKRLSLAVPHAFNFKPSSIAEKSPQTGTACVALITNAVAYVRELISFAAEVGFKDLES
jgi:hypothetical protein